MLTFHACLEILAGEYQIHQLIGREPTTVNRPNGQSLRHDPTSPRPGTLIDPNIEPGVSIPQILATGIRLNKSIVSGSSLRLGRSFFSFSSLIFLISPLRLGTLTAARLAPPNIPTPIPAMTPFLLE